MALWVTWSLVVLAGAMIAAANLRFRLLRRRRLRAMRAVLVPTPAVLKAGRACVSGIAKKRKKSADDVLLSGGRVHLRVQQGRASTWKLSDETREGRSFDLIAEGDQKIRVSLPASARWSIQTDARELNTRDQRSLQFELRDGERVWVEGTLAQVVTKGPAGYRDHARRWVISSRDQAILFRTEGALAALQRTEFAPAWSWALIGVLGVCITVLLTIPEAPARSSESAALLIVLSTLLFSVACALAIANTSGGWIGSRAWFDRKP